MHHVCVHDIIHSDSCRNNLQKIQSAVLVFIICVSLSVIINAQSNSAISFSYGFGSTLGFFTEDFKSATSIIYWGGDLEA